MWTQSAAHSLFDWVNTSITAPDWDTAAEPLTLEGSGVLTTDRIVLWSADRAHGPYYLDGIAITIAECDVERSVKSTPPERPNKSRRRE